MRAEDIGFYPNGAPEAGEAEGRSPSSRRGRPRRDPGGTWALRESTWNATQRAECRAAILAQLREAFPEGERGLAGWPAICAWFNSHGFRNREGRLVTPRVAAGWRRRLNMPVLRGRPGQNGLYGASLPWASTYLLLAWAASLYRSGGPEMPRIVASGSTQNEGREAGPGFASSSHARGGSAAASGSAEKARATAPDERAAIAATSPTASGDCGVPKPAAEATANSNAAERVCTWCAWKWLSPTPFRRVRCPRCTIVADPEVPL